MFKFVKKSLFIVIFSLCGIAAFSDTTHVVQKGETLYGIAKKYSLSVKDIYKANNLTENDVIKAGQKLKIPVETKDDTAQVSVTTTGKTTTYVVQKGDTFYGIAKNYGIKVDELYSLNGMSSKTLLKVGMKLKVPGNEAIADIKDVDPKIYSETKNSAGLVWPVKNPKVTYVKGKVSGVQLTSQAKENVTNIHAGTVMFCGTYRGFGEVVFVQSKTGLMYVYTGLSSVKVKKGNYVVFGDVIGKAGVDSVSNKNGIMLMVIQNGKYMDPAKAPRG